MVFRIAVVSKCCQIRKAWPFFSPNLYKSMNLTGLDICLISKIQIVLTPDLPLYDFSQIRYFFFKTVKIQILLKMYYKKNARIMQI
jgi:hypothetical protein